MAKMATCRQVVSADSKNNGEKGRLRHNANHRSNLPVRVSSLFLRSRTSKGLVPRRPHHQNDDVQT